MTPNQEAAVQALREHAGRTVQVLTSGYTANVSQQAVSNSVATVSSAALRGLEKKGFLKIECAYWKGATVTVLGVVV